MKIASFNVNGIKARLTTLLRWLKDARPDIVVLQEIKSTNETFPANELEDLGYNVVTHGQKSFNGVAILSVYPIEGLKLGLNGDPNDLQARWIEAEINTIRICGLYLPNGNPCPGPKFDYKMEWMDRLYKRSVEIIATEQPSIILGDYNVIPQDEDAAFPEIWKNDALYHIYTRSKFRRIMNLGFTDAFRSLYPMEKAYTFWDYQKGSWQRNNGIRIDHVLLTPQVADRLKSCQIDNYVRGELKPSDHVPIWIELWDRNYIGTS